MDPTPDEVVRDGRLSGYGGHVQEGGAQLELHLRPVTLLQVRTASEALHWGSQQVWRLDVYAQPGNGQDWPWPQWPGAPPVSNGRPCRKSPRRWKKRVPRSSRARPGVPFSVFPKTR
ncbi:MAG: hypothetical protein R3E96_15705 [Planctomycetota bacterium]